MVRRPRLTYANVVATLALFIALGGASYAAVELPAGSVGSKQLKARSITSEKLSFPLGAVGTTDWKKDELWKADGCNAPASPEQKGLTRSCPPLGTVRLSKILGRESAETSVQTITLSRPGKLLVSGVAELANNGPIRTWASVTAAVVVDHVVIARPTVEVEGDGDTEMPLDGVVNVSGGTHHFYVAFEAEYSSYRPGQVLVDPVTLWAETLPG